MYTTSVSLVERLRQPADAEAWARFVDLYTPLLFYWARRTGMQESDAADLVQEVFVLLLRRLPEFTYQPGKSFRSWLRTVTLNKWRDMHKRQHPRQQDAELLDNLPSPSGLEELWEAEYRHSLVRRGLEVMQSQFHPTTWKACWEHVVCGRPAAEVAAELGISENAVYVANSRVLRHLRQELQGLMD